jgi:hypothetical protein
MKRRQFIAGYVWITHINKTDIRWIGLARCGIGTAPPKAPSLEPRSAEEFEMLGGLAMVTRALGVKVPILGTDYACQSIGPGHGSTRQAATWPIFLLRRSSP